MRLNGTLIRDTQLKVLNTYTCASIEDSLTSMLTNWWLDNPIQRSIGSIFRKAALGHLDSYGVHPSDVGSITWQRSTVWGTKGGQRESWT